AQQRDVVLSAPVNGFEFKVITVSEGQGIYGELSAAQAGIWFGHQLDPSGHGYNIGEYVEFQGEIDLALFRKAFIQAFRETEALNLQLSEGPEGVRQTVASSLVPDFQFFDMSREPDPVAAARSWMHADLF
ncbi:condensation domain-containing protein, partial [Streptomyces sp. MCAF7]